jgi:CubicO group peptidase (beta-lactamase class C family)
LQVLRGEYATHPEMAAAGLWTTPSDLLRFGLAVQRAYAGAKDAILPQALAREALTPLPKSEFGLGFQQTTIDGWIGFGHDGSNQGFKASLVMCRDSERGAAVMTNGDSGSAMLAPAARLVGDLFGWREAPSPAAR